MKPLRLLTGLTLFVLVLSACMTATPAPAPTQPPAATSTPAPQAQPPASPIVLKLDGTGGAKTLTMDDLKALPATEGWAGIKSSTGKITIPERFKGVAVDELCKLVGGLSPNTGVSVVAKDGYAMTVSYDQVTQGDFITYDPGTGDEIKPKDPLKVIIAYEKEGKPLPEDSEGTLRLVVVTAKNNQVVDGHWSVKWVNQIAVKSLAQEWKLPLEGAIKEDMDRGTFQSCSSPSCHGAAWTDDKAQDWSGVPLWMLVARVDDETKHGDGAYNDKLAEQGYTVEVIAADGYKVVMDSARVKRNRNIVMAYLVNNNPLDDKYFPLRLVGSDLQKNEMVGQIAKITIRMAQQAATTPEATKASQPQATQAPAASGNAALTVTGMVDKELTLTMDALKGVGVVKIKAEHPKKGMQDYEGVRLNALLDQAKVKASATKLLMISSDGYTVEVGLADARKCADCLIFFDDVGKLDAAMPGMQTNFWAKDVVKIEVK
jgi:DMSO/TMAO reductase YedYZ molybdopterin-dependent catalytic subunit